MDPKNIYFAVVVLFFSLCINFSKPLSLSAQNSQVEELLNDLNKSQDDTAIIRISSLLVFELKGVNRDSARFFCQQAAKSLSNLEDSTLRATNLLRVARNYQHIIEYDTALFYYNQSEQLANYLGEDQIRVRALNSIGNVYMYKKQPEKALDFYEKTYEIHQTRGDTTQFASLLNNIASAYLDQNRNEQAMSYYKQSLSWLEKEKNSSLKLVVLQNMAQININWGELDSALYYYEYAIEISAELDNVLMQARILSRMGAIYKLASDFVRALEYSQKALAIREELGDQNLISISLSSIGNIYRVLKDYDKAIAYIKKSLNIRREFGNKVGESYALDHLGEIHLEREEYEQALFYLFQSLELSREVDLHKYQAYPLSNIGQAYEKMGKLDSAYLYLQEALSISEQYQVLYVQIVCLTDIGKIYWKQKNYSEALAFLEKAHNIIPEGSQKNEKKDILELLYLIHKAQGDTDKALAYHEVFKQLEDDIFNEENNLDIARLESNYTFEKEKQQLEYEQTQEIARQEASRLAILVALGFAIILILIVGWNYFQKQKANIKLQELNTKIVSQNTKLAELDKVKSRFFANISHELRTPLTLITGPIKSISQIGTLNKQQEKYLNLIETNAQKLLKRTNDILDLSKLDANKLQLQEYPTNLYEFIDLVFYSFESAALHRNIQLKLDFLPSRDLEVLLDRDKFDKILSNYISNALKYTEKHGHITLSVKTQDALLIFELADTGYGIHPDELPYIFDRYYQASNSQNKGGTGIGLAFCKELAKLMGGKVRAESTLNKGSSFFIEIPLKIVEQSALPLERREQEEAVDTEIHEEIVTLPLSALNDHQATILLVEDNSSLRTYIAETLNDYHIIQAENGKEALDVLEKSKQSLNVDLIISDIMMPQMDGHELLTLIKAHPIYQKIPVVMLTALAADDSKLKALRTGVDDYLLKPFSPWELKARIANLIRNYQFRNQYINASEQEVEENQASHLDIQFEETPTANQKWLADLESLVKVGIEKKAGYTVGDIADQMAIGQRQLLRKLKALTGLSIKQYIQEIKLQKARHLLENQSFHTIAEVAYSCGFNTPSYFTKLFEERFGTKPSEYLESVLKSR